MGTLCGFVCRGDRPVGRRWLERLLNQGLEGNSGEELMASMITYLGQKQWLEHVESNRLVEEFC